MKSYPCPSGCELVTLASTLSCIIAKNLSNDDLNILSCLFSSIGDNLATISAVRSSCDNNFS